MRVDEGDNEDFAAGEALLGNVLQQVRNREQNVEKFLGLFGGCVQFSSV